MAYQGYRYTGGRKPMIRWVDFSAVKRAVSLEAVLRHYQIPGLRRHRDQLQGCCPIHRGQRDDSFRAHLTKNIFQCFACDAGGTVLDFVAAMEQCSIREAALHLQQWVWGSCVGAAVVSSRGGQAKKGTGSERRREQPFAAIRSDRRGKESPGIWRNAESIQLLPPSLAWASFSPWARWRPLWREGRVARGWLAYWNLRMWKQRPSRSNNL